MKKTRAVTHNDALIEQQRWFAMQGCTNYLAAGFWKMCTFHTYLRGYLDLDSFFDTVEIHLGERSRLDNEHSGLEYQLYHYALA
jgi:hypothetical protein